VDVPGVGREQQATCQKKGGDDAAGAQAASDATPALFAMILRFAFALPATHTGSARADVLPRGWRAGGYLEATGSLRCSRP